MSDSDIVCHSCVVKVERHCHLMTIAR